MGGHGGGDGGIAGPAVGLRGAPVQEIAQMFQFVGHCTMPFRRLRIS